MVLYIKCNSENKPGTIARFCGNDFVRIWKVVCMQKQRQGIYTKRENMLGNQISLFSFFMKQSV